jgi:hypothetical protein
MAQIKETYGGNVSVFALPGRYASKWVYIGLLADPTALRHMQQFMGSVLLEHTEDSNEDTRIATTPKPKNLDACGHCGRGSVPQSSNQIKHLRARNAWIGCQNRLDVSSTSPTLVLILTMSKCLSPSYWFHITSECLQIPGPPSIPKEEPWWCPDCRRGREVAEGSGEEDVELPPPPAPNAVARRKRARAGGRKTKLR